MKAVSYRTHSDRIVHSLPERSAISRWQYLVAVVIHRRVVHLWLAVHRRGPSKVIALWRELLRRLVV